MRKVDLFLLTVLLGAGFLNAQNSCDNLPKNYTGYCQEYHTNSQVSWIKEYKEGKATGIWMYFNEEGVLTKQLNTALKKDSLDKIVMNHSVNQQYDGFANEGFTEGISYFDPAEMEIKAPQGDEVLTFVEEDAQFIGNLNDYITKKLVYPKELSDMDVTGKCYVKFVVEKDGQISNISVIRGVPDCPQCDKEAVRLVKSMPLWKAAKNGGKAVRAWRQIPISFTLK